MDTLRSTAEPQRFGPFALDRRRRVLTRNGDPISLSRAEFDTLAFLLANDGRIVTKDELLAAVWPGRIVEESSISQAVYKLRQTLGDRRLILTESGRGYRFTGPPAETDVSPAPRRSRFAVAFKGWGRAAQMAVGLAAVLLAVGRGLVALDPWGGLFHKDPAGVVVFADFLNQTGDPVFDRTLATAAEIDMRQSPHLTVLTEQQVQDSLNLMVRPKDTPLTPPVAREVCVRNNGQEVLDGGISRFGEHYLLTLTATRCADGQVIAAAKAEAASRETLLPTLDGLVDRVRRSLGETGASVDKFNVPLERRRTASLDALKAYSEATSLADHGRRIESIPLYQHAIELDPKFAPGHYGYALALQWEIWHYSTRPFSEVQGLPLEEALIAVSLDDKDAMGHAVLAHMRMWGSDWEAAIAEARKAVALNPNGSFGIGMLGCVLGFGGYREEALDCLRQAMRASQVL